MGPKKAHRAEGSNAASPAAQKREKARIAKEEAESALEAERVATIQADPLVLRHSDANPALKVSDIFNEILKRKTFVCREDADADGKGNPRRTGTFDWSIFKEALAARNAESPTWFVHIRTEDLLLEPKGLDGEKIEVAVVVEASEPTLAPMHMVYREARPHADVEDNPPERVIGLDELQLCWREARADDGAVINVFVLQFAAQAAPVFPTAVSFGLPPAAGAQTTTAAPAAGFGGAALAPAAGFGAAKAAAPFGGVAPAAGFGAGFGKRAAAAASVGFGAPVVDTRPMLAGRPVSAEPAEIPKKGGLPPAAAAAAAAPLTFGGKTPAFGSAAAAGAAAVAAAAPQGFGAKAAVAAPASKISDVGSATFTLWTTARLNEMRKEIRAGSRIVVENFPLPAPVNRKIKLQMQNDVNDRISDAAEAVIRKEFARLNSDIVKLDKWIDECPIYDPKLREVIAKVRDQQIARAMVSETQPTYATIATAIRPIVTAKLEQLVSERKKMLDEEVAAVQNILQLLKKRVLLPRHSYRILKYYPANDQLQFRPYGKVTGVHEAGEAADVCIPPAYVTQNGFAARERRTG